MSATPPQIPDHQLIKCVGRGAYGEVWLARSVTGAYRAVKIVTRSSFDHERPFEREFEGILKFEPISRQHDSQVDILHVGRGDGCFYYVMELADDVVTGDQINPDNYTPRTLKSDVFQRARVPFEECVQIGIALTTALENLHDNGLVHRDVKPSNIIFVNGVPKLADIGLVAGVDATRSYVGTEGFAAPEGSGTAQADLYSLGKVLYEIATGKDRQEFPELPTQLRELPDREGLMELNAVIARACRHDPADRYASATEMRGDLELLQSGKSLARLHRMEQRISKLTRVGVVLGIIVILVAGAFLFQARETRLAKIIAGQNRAIAEQGQRKLLHHEISTGNLMIEQRDYHTALLWFAEALKRVSQGSKEDFLHRVRIQSVLDGAPRLVEAFGYRDLVGLARFSPDGEFFVKVERQGVARLWRTSAGQSQMHEVSLEPKGTNEAVAFSRDSKRLLIASGENGVRVLDAGTGRILLLHRREGEPVTHASIGPDGHRVLIQTGAESARIWDVDHDKQIGRELTNGVSVSEFSSDGKLVLTATCDSTPTEDGDHSVGVWSSETGELVTLLKHDRIVDGATFSPDGRHVATESGGNGMEVRASVWNLSGNLEWESKVHTDSIQHISFSPDGKRLITASDDRTARIWDTKTGAPKSPALIHGDSVTHASFSPDGRLVITASADGKARLWDSETGAQVLVSLNHADMVTSVAFHPDGRHVLTCGGDATGEIWDTSLDPERKTSLHAPGSISTWDFSPNSKKIALVSTIGSNSVVFIHNLESGKESILSTQPIPPELSPGSRSQSVDYRGSIGVAHFALGNGYGRVSFSPDGRFLLATGGRPGRFCPFVALPRLFETISQREINTFDNQSNSIDGCFSPDGTMIAIANLSGQVRVWNTQGQALTPPLPCGESFAQVTFSPDSRYLFTGNYDGTAKLWDMVTHGSSAPTFREIPQTHGVRSASFTPNGRIVVLAGIKASLWNVANAEPATESLPSTWISFSEDGRFMLTEPTRTSLAVRSGHTGESVLASIRLEGRLEHSEFSRDGRFIATASDDGKARIWETEAGQPLTPPLELTSYFKSAHFCSDGSRLLTGPEGGTVTLWNLRPIKRSVEDIVDLAQVLSGHALEDNESVPVNPRVLRLKLARLRASHPKLFSPVTELGKTVQ